MLKLFDPVAAFASASRATPQSPPSGMRLGWTLPQLLQDVAHSNPLNPSKLTTTAQNRRHNPQAFNQWSESGWQSYSQQTFYDAARSGAIGLLSLGLNPGDRVAFLLQSDVNFCIADMSCLIAGLVNVPIDVGQTVENILYVLQHSEAKALIISSVSLLEQISAYLVDIPHLQHVIVANVPDDWSVQSSVPESTPVRSYTQWSLAEIQQRGETAVIALPTIHPHQLATIIYIPSEHDELLGVMLTHENLSANAFAAFSGLPRLKWGAHERVLSFLPLTHVFARSLIYGHIYYGHSIYFSSPTRVMKHLKTVQPTVMATVPLLLEKLYAKSLETINHSSSHSRSLMQWALKRAQSGEYERSSSVRAMSLQVANWLVLSQWRSLFGGRLSYLLSGGAALDPVIARTLNAAGIRVLQGYGLTQTSAVVTHNRSDHNRIGSVGLPVAGMEVAIADDGEVIVRGPCVMTGYYKNPVATKAVMDDSGWFHTGDFGQFDADGFLHITGVKKALFKLSSGKYIAPEPLESRLRASPFVQQAIVVGMGRKFCAALIFPNWDLLGQAGRFSGREASPTVEIDELNESALHHSCIDPIYEAIVNMANCHAPYWGIIKRFQLISEVPTQENGLLHADGTLNRATALQRFATEIEAIYQEGSKSGTAIGRRSEDRTEIETTGLETECPAAPIAVCPTVAQSLNSRFITT